jgi:hypothetical protein
VALTKAKFLRDCHRGIVNCMGSGTQQSRNWLFELTPRWPVGGVGPRLLQLQLWFYLGVPLINGLMLGWLQVGRTAAWPKPLALLYWVGVSFLGLYVFDIGTRPLARVFRAWRVPLWLTLLTGQMILSPLVLTPLVQLWRQWIYGFLPPGEVLPQSAFTLALFVQSLPTNVAFWLGINLLFYYGFGMPRMGYVPPSAGSVTRVPDGNDAATGEAAGSQATAAGRPSFLSRVRPDRRGPLLALRAEGHYLRVYTEAGSDLILCRLSDALHELDEQEGIRVHRSWWVAERALSGGRSAEGLQLRNGLDVPVSRSYRIQARERGWLR